MGTSTRRGLNKMGASLRHPGFPGPNKMGASTRRGQASVTLVSPNKMGASTRRGQASVTPVPPTRTRWGPQQDGGKPPSPRFPRPEQDGGLNKTGASLRHPGFPGPNKMGASTRRGPQQDEGKPRLYISNVEDGAGPRLRLAHAPFSTVISVLQQGQGRRAALLASQGEPAHRAA